MDKQNEKKTVGRWLYDLVKELTTFTLVVKDERLLEAFKILKEWAGHAFRFPVYMNEEEYYILYALMRLNFNGGKISDKCEEVVVLPYDPYERAMRYWECRRHLVESGALDRMTITTFYDPCSMEDYYSLTDRQYRREYRCIQVDLWRDGTPKRRGVYVAFNGDVDKLTPKEMAEMMANGQAHIVIERGSTAYM